MTLEVKNATFGYRKNPILEDISLSAANNSIVTILGPNGVGKTTLLKCIMGFLKLRSGEVLLNGKPVNEYSNKEFWQRISYVPQAKKSVFSYRVLDAVVMGLNAGQNFFATPKHEDYEKAMRVIEAVGATQLTDKYCNELSGGELQLVMIARALVSEPELLILDEPESNLDMRNQLCVLNIIEQVSRNLKTSCLINTHFPNHALKISDQTLLLG
jgi:iron complex transport system ATP-binding protein